MREKLYQFWFMFCYGAGKAMNKCAFYCETKILIRCQTGKTTFPDGSANFIFRSSDRIHIYKFAFKDSGFDPAPENKISIRFL